jgi:hypothetical protein
MTAATRRRVRAAVLAVSMRQREQHLAALAGLLHLVEHCPEGREPRGFVAGHRAYRLPELRWAAELLEHPWIECTALDCKEPLHVTLRSAPLEASAGIRR